MRLSKVGLAYFTVGFFKVGYFTVGLICFTVNLVHYYFCIIHPLISFGQDKAILACHRTYSRWHSRWEQLIDSMRLIHEIVIEEGVVMRVNKAIKRKKVLSQEINPSDAVLTRDFLWLIRNKAGSSWRQTTPHWGTSFEFQRGEDQLESTITSFCMYFHIVPSLSPLKSSRPTHASLRHVVCHHFQLISVYQCGNPRVMVHRDGV